ncbi:MAG: hypothetical protein ABIO72_01725 [Patescibacteria group bacterium]
MFGRAIGCVFFLVVIGLLGFAILSIPPGEKRFKTAAYDLPDQGWRISSPGELKHLYGRLDEKDVDYVTFTIDHAMPLAVSLKNPAGDAGFEPTFIIFGPGLPAPTDKLPIDIGSNGAIMAQTVRDKQHPVFDASEFTTYLTGPSVTADLRVSGTYAVAILSTKESAGRYVLSIGNQAAGGLAAQFALVPATLKALLRLY